MRFLRLMLTLSVGLLGYQATVFAQSASRTSASMQIFGTSIIIPGTESSLIRNRNGIAMTINTTDLPEGTYTNWWVIFNHPDECLALPCGPADLGNPDVAASVLFATGHVVNNGDNVNFAGSLQVGDTSGARFGPGVLDPFAAEVHLIVRYHGDPIPGEVSEQISTFGGGCVINVCEDLQAAIHLP